MNLFELFATAIVWTPENIGRFLGAGFVLLAIFTGILKCWFIMQRPSTSNLCVLSLLVFLSAWLISSAGAALALVFEFPPVFALISGLLSGLLLFTAFVLGIVALATYDHQRFRQGRAQAVWAIVLSFLMILLAVALALIPILTANNDAIPPGKSRSGTETIENIAYNFSVTPSSSWAEIKPSALNDLACLALRQIRPETFCVVIAERLPNSTSLETITEIAKSTMDISARVLERSEEIVELNGLTFAHLTTRAHLEAANLTLDYEHWIATQGGFSWQIIFWGPQGQSELASRARGLVETFQLLDPNREAISGGSMEDLNRPEFGYETKLDGLGWAPWTTPGLNALIDFRAQRINEALVVVPLRFESEPPDLMSLRRGLLSIFNLENKPEEYFKEKPWSPGHGGTGRELEIETDVDGDRFHYIFRVARSENSAHLIAGWAAVPDGDKELLRRSMDAITLRPAQGEPPTLRPDQRKARGLLLNEVGLSLMNRNEYVDAASWFQKGFALGNDPTILGNAGDALASAGLAARGVDLLSPHMKEFSTHRYLGLRYARLQVLNVDPDGGGATFLRLLEQGLNDEDELLSWLQLLNENQHFLTAQQCVDAWVAQIPTKRSRRWQSQVYRSNGDYEKALQILEKLRDEDPDNREAAFFLGEYYNETGENTKAAAVAEALMADENQSARALMILGWSQMGRKWYRDAKSSFESAAKLDPKNEDVQEAIRTASAYLGQGDNSDVKKPILPVDIPPELAAALDRKTTLSDFGRGHGSAYVMKNTGWHFEKGKPIRKTIRRRAKILSPEGARDFGSIEVTFNPLNERIFMNRLEVKDAEGKTLAQASLDDAYVRDLDDGIASHEKILHMQVAGVQPGTTVEWEVTTEDLASADRFPFQRHLFASGIPVASETVFVSGDISMVHSHLDQGKDVEKIQNDKLMAWIASDQPAAPSEPYATPIERRCPMLWLGGREGTWKDVGQSYLKQIEDRLVVDQDLKNFTASVVKGLHTDREKIAAIARYTREEIAYKAIGFGVRARRPNSPADTIRLRYGDCKDMALLTHLMLSVEGIPSHLALVDTAWDTQPDFPSLDQFNHMVVMLPSLGPNWLLDATNKTLDSVCFPADSLWHTHALILDPEGSHLVEPPSRPAPESCQVGIQRKMTLDDDNWNVEETLSLTGYYGSWMRDAFSGLSPTEQRAKAQGILTRQGAAQVRDFHFKNLEDPETPARITLSYSIPNEATAINGHLSGRLPALWERDYLTTEFVKDRKTAFEITYPLHVTCEITATLPSAPLPESLDTLAKQASSKHGTWSVKPEGRGNEVILQFDFLANPGTHPAESYPDFHKIWDSARRSLDSPIIWPRK